MKINLKQKKNEHLDKDEFEIELQYSIENKNLQHLIDYINEYTLNKNNKVIVASDDYTLLEIEYKDIITTQCGFFRW